MREFVSSKIRIGVFAAQILFVGALAVVWFTSARIQTSKDLYVLFFYCFPSEFLIAIVPHEPVILYFAKFYSAFTVTAVSVVGTLCAEALNYSLFKHVSSTSPLKKFASMSLVNKTVQLFKRSPFFALCVAGFTPVPFYPMRFLAVMANYPIERYLLALLLSRTPRFYLIALFGTMLAVPTWVLVAIFVVMIVVSNVKLVRSLLADRPSVPEHLKSE